MTTLTGTCLCGAVAYGLASEPLRTTVCYCRFCQTATGSTQLILPVLPGADFSLEKGAPATYAHVSEGSGKKICIHFCADCGTKLYLTFERWPDIVGLYGGRLADPGIIPFAPEVAKQIFLSSARPGTIIFPGIPAYWNHATAPDGTPEKAIVLDRPSPVEAVSFD